MKQYKNKDWLFRQYVTNEKSTVDIGEMMNVAPSTISYWLEKFDIEQRSLSESLEGRELSEQSKDKISESVSNYLKENGHPFEGETHTDETLEKMSKAKAGKNHHFYGKDRPEFAEKMSGSNNPSWKGGITKDMDFRKSNKWKMFSNKKRDEANWTCENCGAHGYESEIQTHHAIPVSDGGNKYDNTFIVLCKECHGNKESFWHNSNVDEQLEKVGRINEVT